MLMRFLWSHLKISSSTMTTNPNDLLKLHKLVNQQTSRCSSYWLCDGVTIENPTINKNVKYTIPNYVLALWFSGNIQYDLMFGVLWPWYSYSKYSISFFVCLFISIYIINIGNLMTIPIGIMICQCECFHSWNGMSNTLAPSQVLMTRKECQC